MLIQPKTSLSKFLGNEEPNLAAIGVRSSRRKRWAGSGGLGPAVDPVPVAAEEHPACREPQNAIQNLQNCILQFRIA